ncbi:restriction endonuclease subunit S [Nioella sp.]|uniref:restriction endonuclease subunit S n=1 Tax=Nioella sp. TaxID=1912091 RepID=UPI003A85E08D
MKDVPFSAARLLELYDRISDAEDAIPRLRRFVLDLAVRGKLVEQEASDEPAAELLTRIVKEKARLVKAGEIKPQKPIPNVEADELAFHLPKGWAAARLAEVAVCLDYMRKPINGTEREKRIEGKSSDDLYPYFGATQQQGWIDEYIFDEELILLGEDGIPFFDLLRSKAYVISGKTWVNNHAHVFRGILVSNRFFVHYLNVFDYSGRVVGATRAKLNQAKAVDIPVPLPPLAEQHRIVAKVDELMALCDQLEQARAGREAVRDRLTTASLARLTAPDTDAQALPAEVETALSSGNATNTSAFQSHARFALQSLPTLTTRPDQINTLRQTILNLAVRGKLVAQDAGDEPAAYLLKRIEAEKARLLNAGKIREAKAVEPAKPVLGYSALPKGWQQVTVANVAYLRSGVALVHDEEQDSGEIPYLKVADLSLAENDNGIITSSRFVSGERRGDVIVAGSIVFPKRGGAIATNRKRVSKVDIVGDSNLMAMKPFVDGTMPFVKMWFNSFDLWVLNSGTSVPQINNKDIYPLELPLPPLAEQHRIVAKVDALMALCDQLEASLTTTATTRSKLLNALLHEALEPAADELEAAE